MDSSQQATSQMLHAIEMAATALRLEAVRRPYRHRLTANYRCLFPDAARHYRADVLEASLEVPAPIWLNGEKFELSSEVGRRATALQEAWSSLLQLLDEVLQAKKEASKQVLAPAMDALDAAWVGFEETYFAELIEIEERARRLIKEPAELEAKLSSLEDRPMDASESRFVQKKLVQQIARLNSVANFRGVGRDDLGSEILDSARTVLTAFRLSRKDITAASEGRHFAVHAIRDATSQSAGVAIAVNVVGSFEAIRWYLREAKKRIDRIHPRLRDNAGLVTRLADYEESWQNGARYLLQTMMLDANNDLVAECKIVQRLTPALRSMCAGYDVELFFVLPRIVLLCCLEKPDDPRVGLLKDLLPHHFDSYGQKKSVRHWQPGPGLRKLLTQYQEVRNQLIDSGDAAPQVTFLRKAVGGFVGAAGAECPQEDDGLRHLPPSVRDQVEALMREVEGWSLELQRHNAQAWNQCGSVLVQSLNGTLQRQLLLPPTFRV